MSAVLTGDIREQRGTGMERGLTWQEDKPLKRFMKQQWRHTPLKGGVNESGSPIIYV
jgi:hypothetical protein